MRMIVNQLMRKIGFIREKELIGIAVETYEKNCPSVQTDENDFYFRCGNANALGYLLSRLGIDITKELKQRKSDDR